MSCRVMPCRVVSRRVYHTCISHAQLLERLRKDGGPTTVRLMNAVVDACRKGKQWEKALEMLADMKEHGVTPDDFTYTAAIAACRQGRQWDKVNESINQWMNE